ncbi:MAG: hypothetical protein ABFC94_18890 [Syntrophomonas sp.]
MGYLRSSALKPPGYFRGAGTESGAVAQPVRAGGTERKDMPGTEWSSGEVGEGY